MTAQFAATAVLHVDKGPAERVRTSREVFAGKLVAVGQAMIKTVHPGAGQNRAGAAELLLLCQKLHFGQLSRGRAAAAAYASKMQTTG